MPEKTDHLKVLFFLESDANALATEDLTRELLERGHAVHVAFDHQGEGVSPDGARLCEELQEQFPAFDYEQLPARKDLWRIPARGTRRSLDYLHHLDPETETEGAARDAAREQAPGLFRGLLVVPPFRWQPAQQLLGWWLGHLEAGMPLPRGTRALLEVEDPDAVVVSPLVEFGSMQGDQLRVATEVEVPTVFVVAGDEDLTARGAVRDEPTLTIVSDAAQSERAQRQGLPSERIFAAGAARENGSAAFGRSPGEAIEWAAAEGAGAQERRRGRLLRPLLWLLTPLLVLLLPLLRPRATAWAVARAVRSLARRVRKRFRTMQKQRQRQRKLKQAEAVKAAAHAAKQKQRERAAALKAEQKQEQRAAALETEKEVSAKKAVKAAADPSAAEAAPTTAAERKAAKVARKAEMRAEKAAKAGKAGKAAGSKAGKAKPKPPLWQRKAVKARVKAARRRWKLTRRAVRRGYNRRYRWSYGRTIDRVPSRDELPALLNARGLLGKGVEIGVKTGLYSDSLLSNWKGAELISIDPWIEAAWEEYVDRSNVSQTEFNANYEETKERLSVHGSRSTIWRLTSVEGAEKVAEHELDFAYIDARHDYDSVLEDLHAWASKVKPGGILAGHDYVDGDLPQGEFYVKSAVDEYFGERAIPVHGTEGPSIVEMFPTWIVEVPEGGIPQEPTVPDFVKTPPPKSKAAREAAAKPEADQPQAASAGRP